MSLIELERERRDDHCPACGEGIDWESGDHEILESGWSARCWITRASFDLAVLE
jgi:hypothetical protein